MKVSFSGIYDLRFPVGTQKSVIEDKYQKAEKYISDNKLGDIFRVDKKDYFDITKTKQPCIKQGIRITSTIDNPYLMFDLFETMDKNLGQEYINKSKVELVLNA